jgi:hypothetical protein
MIVEPTADQRSALTRAAELVSNQAEGLRLTGSKTTEAALKGFADTLRSLAAAPRSEIGDMERLHLENASFVLEGIRDGLLTAEFRERAAVINQDIRALNALIGAYNAASRP